MGELVNMEEWVERRETAPNKREIYKRLGEIAMDIILLESEKARLESLLWPNESTYTKWG